MRVKLFVLAAALSLAVTGVAEAKGLRDLFDALFGLVGNGHEHGSPNHSVPEPSTLYALGSGLALLGGVGWFLRRK